MKTTVMRRITTLLLTVVMLLGVAVPAVFAEDAVPGAAKTFGEDQDNYSKGVWLHAALGSFSGTYKSTTAGAPEVNISGLPSVWVNFADPANRTLPTNLPTISAAQGGSVRWFTAPPTVTEVAAAEGNYSYRTATGNGFEVHAGESVPQGVQVLYSTFDYSIPSAGDSDPTGKFVTFYLDWNGINGMFGHCLTCTRSLTEGGVMFTIDSATVSGLNAEFTKEFESSMAQWKTLAPTAQWQKLTEYWADHPMNGYTFKGWSLTPTGQPITTDTPITNGMSFYAVWEKNGQTNADFSRVDPEAGPADSIHFVNLSASGHAKEGASAQIQAAITPTRAVAKITWTVTYKVGDKSLQETFTDTGKTVTVPHNGTYTGNGFKAVASDKTLTITNLDKTSRSFVISASCQSEGGSVVTVPTAANVTFSHSWKLTSEQKPTCTADGKNVYTCEVCSATREETRKSYGHNWSWTTTAQPTCDTAGNKHRVCLNCGMVKENDETAIPALGHKYTWVRRAEPTCATAGQLVQVCSVCGGEGASQSIPALGHQYSWVTTKEATCDQDGTMVEVCQRAGCHTQGATKSIPAIGHVFEWKTVKEATCEDKGLMEEYCVRDGCSAKGKTVDLEPLGHTFKWVATKEPTTESEGVKTSKCSTCGKILNETIPKLQKPAETPTPKPTAAPTAAPTPKPTTAPAVTATAKPTVSSTVQHASSSTVQHAASSTVQQAAPSTTQHTSSSTVQHAASSTVQQAAPSTTQHTVSSTVQQAASSTVQQAAAPTAAPTTAPAVQPTVSSTVQHAAAPTAAPTAAPAVKPAATAQPAKSVTGTVAKSSAVKATSSLQTSARSKNSFSSALTGSALGKGGITTSLTGTPVGKSAQYLAVPKVGGVTTSSSASLGGSRLGALGSVSSSALGKNTVSSVLTGSSLGSSLKSFSTSKVGASIGGVSGLTVKSGLIGASSSSTLTSLSSFGKSSSSTLGSLTGSKLSSGLTGLRTASVSGANKGSVGKVSALSSFLTRY